MSASLDPVLELWIARFRGPLIGLLASRGANWGDAEELAQDALAEAWLSRARLRGDAADSRIVGPWLRGIAMHLLQEHRRRQARQRHEPLPEELAKPTAVADDRLDVLRAAFAKLRPDLQTVLRMFYLDEASTREVAALLDLSEKAVESRLHQARRAMRAHAERLQSALAGETR